MNEYIFSLLHEKNEFLDELRHIAIEKNTPILRRDAASMLELLVTLKKPENILEAGTAIGYSSLLMSFCAPDAIIDTVEIDMETAFAARANIERAGRGEKIRVICGDAAEVFSCMGGQYDMIFVDSAKGRYLDMYGDIKRLLKSGGVLVCDNVIFYGKIFDKPDEAPHKHRTIVSNLRAFLEKLTSDNDFCSTVLTIGDGVAVAVKN